MAGDGAPRLMSFVSEKEIADVKKKRQEEWEKARKPSDPVDRPDEVYDPRPLYERLKEQRDKKQEQWDEQFKFKNMIYKGLDDEEAVFLQRVADKKAAHNAEVAMTETEELSEFRVMQQAVAELAENDSKVLTTITSPNANSASGAAEKKTSSVKKSSLASLIGSSIKRKRTSSENTEKEQSTISPVKTKDKKLKLSIEGDDRASDKTISAQDTYACNETCSQDSGDKPVAQIITSRLPGLSQYSDSSGESSDDD